VIRPTELMSDDDANHPLLRCVACVQVDLVGGYYDSGDHVKFGFPMAYAVTMLAWGVLEFEKEMVAANNHQRALDAIRWGTNYFVKAHTEPNSLWVQVRVTYRPSGDSRPSFCPASRAQTVLIMICCRWATGTATTCAGSAPRTCPRRGRRSRST
jgi:hypothetical protein